MPPGFQNGCASESARVYIAKLSIGFDTKKNLLYIPYFTHAHTVSYSRPNGWFDSQYMAVHPVIRASYTAVG